MFYTPNRDDYLANLQVGAGLDQEVAAGQILFDTNYLAAFEMLKSIKDYYPMIISVNYIDNGAQFAMMTYCSFSKDGNDQINGVHVIKQVVLVSAVVVFCYMTAGLIRLIHTCRLTASPSS